MSDRYQGGIISPTAPVPTGGGAGDSASGIWTLEQAAPYIAQGNWPGTGIPDPQFQYVTALLHGDGVNGGQNNTFLDSSSNNFTITRNGNTTQGSFSPYGNLWSNNFTASGSSFLSIPANSGFNDFGTGDFTIECWFFARGTSGYGLAGTPTFNTSGWILLLNNSTAGRPSFMPVPFSNEIESTVSYVPNTWNHFAVTRSSGTITLWLNGASVRTATYTASISNSNALTIGQAGAGWDARYYFDGYISNFRIVKGTAVYTSAFTPSTTPLTAVSGTSVLTCQSNRFVDNSTNNFAITASGSPSVQRFSPFQNLATYNTAVIGGSGFFDGTGDTLNTASSAAFGFGTGSWTLEAWVYPTTAQTDNWILATNDSGKLRMRVGASGFLSFFTDTGSISLNSTTVVTVNAWSHVAICYDGTNLSLFQNGVRTATATASINNGSANSCFIGSNTIGGSFWNGYISNARVLKGTALYSGSTYTIPTAPLTNITNTSLLTNFTNGAIFDSDASNNLETVGNAQISTSVVKYGTGSMAFDGTGDYLASRPATTDLYAFSTGNFTIEMWAYFNVVNADQSLYDTRPTGTNGAYQHIYLEGSTGRIIYQANTNSQITSSSALSASTWYHIALTRSGTSTRLFINGTQSGSTYTDSTNYIVASGRPFIGINASNTSVFNLNGYIDDLRITKGYARYWFNFQPPTRAFPNYGGTLIEANDPLFAYNTLLLSGNGTNGAQNNTFLDSSTNNFTITRNGNTTQGSFSPYGTLWSNYFPSGSRLSVPDNDAFNFGSGNFTIEAWIFPTATGNFPCIAAQFANTDTNSSFFFGLGNSNRNLEFFLYAPSSTNITATNAITLNSWNHVAAVRNGNTVTLYVNGSSVASASFSSTINNSTVPVTIGYASDASTYPYIGYISNLRIVKGSAVYTSNFTPSITPLTAISGTSLLTCADNRFIDDSSNNFTITTINSPSVQRFSPFEPTAPYSTSVIGGSGYFDGSGDSLVTPTTGQFAPAGDFTIGIWFYPLSTKSFQQIIGNYSAVDSSLWIFEITNGTGINFYTNGGTVRISGASVIRPNAWNYISLVRSGSTLTGRVNGSTVGTYTQSGTFGSATRAINIGRGGASTDAGDYAVGYIADVELIDGTAVTTVPTVPETPAAGTKLLLSFTNAGIPDLAMMNNLETVGNAQVSTAQSKFGGSSLAFDGTDDRLVAATNPSYAFGTGDFTVEAWIYSNDVSSSEKGFVQTSATIGGLSTTYTTGIYIGFGANGSGGSLNGGLVANVGGTIIGSSTAVLSTGVWYHVALTRSSGTARLFLNGNIHASATATANLTGQNICVGGYYSTSYLYNGFINDLRITRGIARYVQPFTPPTQAFQTY